MLDRFYRDLHREHYDGTGILLKLNRDIMPCQHFKKEAHRHAKWSNQNTMEMINIRKENNTLEYCDTQK
jgi:hypothetical protein